MPGPGGYKPPKPTAPSWWQKVKNALKEMTNIAAQGTVVPKGYVPPTGKPPAWYTPQMSNYVKTTGPNPYDRTPKMAPLPTSSFISGGGQYALTSMGAMPTVLPTSSVVANGGQYVIGPNQRAYNRNQTVNSTVLGAGGQAVRGPDIPIATQTQPNTSDGGGYGYNYKPKKRGGGGGGGGGYQRPAYEPSQYVPEWARGLANWSIG